jgi:hypothetical protein
VPAQTLHRFISTDTFPEAHLAKLEARIAQLLQQDRTALTKYATVLILDYERKMKDLPKLNDNKEEGSRRLLLSGEMMRLFDDIMLLYTSMSQADPVLCQLIYSRMQPLNPSVVMGIAEAVEYKQANPKPSPEERRMAAKQLYKQTMGERDTEAPWLNELIG